MGIKWNDVRICNTAVGNKIILGKVREDNKGRGIFTDKSEDKTEECIKAVMSHMIEESRRNKQKTWKFSIDELCSLEITDLEYQEE